MWLQLITGDDDRVLKAQPGPALCAIDPQTNPQQLSLLQYMTPMAFLEAGNRRRYESHLTTVTCVLVKLASVNSTYVASVIAFLVLKSSVQCSLLP